MSRVLSPFWDLLGPKPSQTERQLWPQLLHNVQGSQLLLHTCLWTSSAPCSPCKELPSPSCDLHFIASSPSLPLASIQVGQCPEQVQTLSQSLSSLRCPLGGTSTQSMICQPPDTVPSCSLQLFLAKALLYLDVKSISLVFPRTVHVLLLTATCNESAHFSLRHLPPSLFYLPCSLQESLSTIRGWVWEEILSFFESQFSHL